MFSLATLATRRLSAAVVRLHSLDAAAAAALCVPAAARCVSTSAPVRQASADSTGAGAGAAGRASAAASRPPPPSLSLSALHDNPGANKQKRKKGRGVGTGLGRTAGEGSKGVKSRQGGSVPLGFEGGQTPLWRRTPKMGYMAKIFRHELEPLNLEKVRAARRGWLWWW
jgi:large subunit ribosomal protein L15